jgi:hypothetical protein
MGSGNTAPDVTLTISGSAAGGGVPSAAGAGSFVFRPTSANHDNVFGTEASLKAAMQTVHGPRTLQIDTTTLGMPATFATAWGNTLDGVTFTSESGADILTFATGCTFTASNLHMTGGVTLTSSSNANVWTLSGTAFLSMEDGSILATSGGVELISVPGGSTLSIVCDSGSLIGTANGQQVCTIAGSANVTCAVNSGPFDNVFTGAGALNIQYAADALASTLQATAAFNVTQALGGFVTYSGVPDGATNNQPALQSAVNKIATATPIGGLFIPKLGSGGNYKVTLGTGIPGSLKLTSLPSVTITSQIPAGDGHTDSPFFLSGFATDPNVSTTNGASLESATTLVVNSVGTLVKGSYIDLQNANSEGSYQVVGIGVTGTVDITAAGLYGGGGSLNGKTLILNVNGAGATTLTLSGAGNTATEAAFMAAILAQWPALHTGVQTNQYQGPGTTGKNLVLTANTLVVGAGTANGTLGISTTNNTLETDIPLGFAWPNATAVNTFTPQFATYMDWAGANIQGAGTQVGRGLWMPGSWRGVCENLLTTNLGSFFGPDWDFAGRSNVFRNITTYGTAVNGPSSGIAYEGGQDGIADGCTVYGCPIGYQIGGVDHEIRSCKAYRGSIGLSLQNQGPGDTADGRYCTVVGGDYSGNTSHGVQIIDNGFGNTLFGFSAHYNGQTGVNIATGTTITPTTGASKNTVVGVIAAGNAVAGMRVGTVSGGTFAHDGNTFSACSAINGVLDGFVTHIGATNTTYDGCYSFGNAGGNGYTVFNATVTGTILSGCVSESNGTVGGTGGSGFLVSNGDATITGCSSVNDTAAGVNCVGAANVQISNFRYTVAANAGGPIGVFQQGTGNVRISGGLFNATGVDGGHFATALYSHSSGPLTFDNVILLGGASSWTTGLLTDGTGDVHIGPGCDFDAATTPVSNGGSGKLTVNQSAGESAIATTGGAKTLTFKQTYNTRLATTGVLTSNTTIAPNYVAVGWQVTFRNNNTGAFTSGVLIGGVTINVAQGKSAIICVNAAGQAERVTADT